MIISRGRRYIFVHIPKTGGTSMALALEARAMKDDLMLGDTPKAKKRRRKLQGVPSRGRLWKHATLSDIDGVISIEDVHSFCVFTLVRNPWDRLVSYYHWLKDQTFDHPAVALAQRTEFREFVCHRQTRASLSKHPVRRYLTDAKGVEVSAICVRLEHLEQDLIPVTQHLGFALDLPKVNLSTRSPDWRPYYDAKSADAVAESCSEDIQRFGYRFDPDPH